MLKISFRCIVFSILLSNALFASENNKTELEQNASANEESLKNKSPDTETNSEVTRKIKEFFGGILDDAKEFAIDNKIIDQK